MEEINRYEHYIVRRHRLKDGYVYIVIRTIESDTIGKFVLYLKESASEGWLSNTLRDYFISIYRPFCNIVV